MEYQLSEEVAEEQLHELLDYYDIALEDFDGAIKTGLNLACKKLIRAIRRGHIEIKLEDERMVVYQQLQKPLKGFEGPIKYREVDGRSKLAMKDASEGDNHGRIFAYLGGLSGEGAKTIQALRGVDNSVAECLGTLFLQV